MLGFKSCRKRHSGNVFPKGETEVPSLVVGELGNHVLSNPDPKEIREKVLELKIAPGGFSGDATTRESDRSFTVFCLSHLTRRGDQPRACYVSS